MGKGTCKKTWKYAIVRHRAQGTGRRQGPQFCKYE